MTDVRTEPDGDSEDDKGIRCRQCGCEHMPVVWTRPVRKNRVRRCRECRNCLRRQTTIEIEVGHSESAS
jgi:transcriptional regulator NrdR family protein